MGYMVASNYLPFRLEKPKREGQEMNTGETTNHPVAIVYARVSTNRQKETGHSLDSQTQRLLVEAQLQGYAAVLVTEIASGGRDSRPVLQAALSDLQQGNAQALFVLDIDRLGRSTQNALKILEKAKKENWRLVVTSLGADTATPAGEMVFTVMAAMARLERRLISERVIRQHEAKKERGITWGLDEGYKGNLSPQVREVAAKLRDEGLGYKRIAKALTEMNLKPAKGGLWYPQIVKAILESPQTKQLRKVA
jgi:DNA invertase Pin-like site-specific DNA recombinase